MAHTEKCRGCRNENRCDFIHCTSEREKEIRAKAIEEFAEQIKARAYSKEYDEWGKDTMISIWESVIDEIAMEMKGE